MSDERREYTPTEYYILDGFETAMVETESHPEEGCDSTWTRVVCPCGWMCSWKHAGYNPGERPTSALHFHYTNCSHAKLRTHPEGDEK